MFSEESKLLIAHWDAVEDIKDAEQRLAGEVTKFLHSFEDVLKQEDWWSSEWSFHPSKYLPSEQVYVIHENWVTEGEDTILIGVENFKPAPIFGADTAPQMYVWVTGKSSKELAGALVECIDGDDTPPLGELDRRPSGYVVKKPLPKCLPDDVDGFREMMTEALMEFFGHYAAYEPKFTEVLKRVMGTDE